MTTARMVAAPLADCTLRLRLPHEDRVVEIGPGGTASGIHELAEATFFAPDEDLWHLEIDDEAIEPNAGSPRCWTWKPGFFAGEVAVRIVHVSSQREAHYKLDVSPDPSKLGRDVFATMLRTLWAEAPELLIGEEPARRPLGASLLHEDPVLAYGRLRRYGLDFVRALEVVEAHPITRLRCERRRLPLHLVRRSDRRTALDLARGGGLGERAELLDAPVVEPTLDNPANRLMLATLQSVLQRTRTCARELGVRSAKEPDSELRTALGRRWPARREFLRQLELELRRLLLRGLFAEIQRPEASPAGLNTVSSHPVYARAHRLGWLCTRRGFAGAATLDELWLPPTWDIYERWCWVTLRRLLESAGFDACAPGTGLPRHQAAWCGVGPSGRRVSLLFQARFPTWSSRSKRRGRSLSSLLIPDIVLVIEGAGEPRFQVFDAKYRASRRAVLDALDAMTTAHVYHDALRLDGHPPDRVLLLVPASGGAPWLEEPSFHGAHGVGVHVLEPDGPIPPWCLAELG